MKTEKTRIRYEGLGFPVILVGAPIRMIDGEPSPDVDLNKLQRFVFEALVHKPTRITGSELKFVRTYLKHTQSDLASHVNASNSSSISQWEGKRDKPTSRDVNTEVVLRMYMFFQSKMDFPHRGKNVTDLAWMRLQKILFGELKKMDESEPVEVDMNHAC